MSTSCGQSFTIGQKSDCGGTKIIFFSLLHPENTLSMATVYIPEYCRPIQARRGQPILIKGQGSHPLLVPLNARSLHPVRLIQLLNIPKFDRAVFAARG